MAYKLQTDIGKAIYGLRKCTVEPVIGIIKEVWAFASSRCGVWWRCGRVVSGLLGLQFEAIACFVGPLTFAASPHAYCLKFGLEQTMQEAV